MRSHILLLWALVFVVAGARAQKTYNVWAFGQNAGLDFNFDPPKPLKETGVFGLKPPGYVSSVCDRNGRLKFYTDGLQVWSAEHRPMPKYQKWWPWYPPTIPLICPYPGSDSLYYLFGISKGLNQHQLLYLTIRLNKAGDYEEVVYPRPTSPTSYYTRLLTNASSLLAGTAHCNGEDTWIVTHTAGALNAFLVTRGGVSTTPVVSSLGVGVAADTINGHYSNIKFSANGERLVLPVPDEGRMVVLDFNNQTGAFSNPVVLAVPPGHTLEDVELSPDGSKLYYGAWEPTVRESGDPGPDLHYVFQLDLNAGTAAQIEQSLYRLGADGSACGRRGCTYVYRTMQLGPDGKIYVSMQLVDATNDDLTLSVIAQPNSPGDDARYAVRRVPVGRKYVFLNYNYIKSGAFSLRENGIVVQRQTCVDQPARFSLLFTRVDSVRWDFGDPASGEDNVSASFTPSHRYPGPGTYTVRAVIYSRCLTDTATLELTVRQTESVRVPAIIKDTTVCTGDVLTLDAKNPSATHFEWDNGLIYAQRTIDRPGRYSVLTWNECSEAKRSFEVKYEDCPCAVFTPNAFTPNGDGLNEEFRPVVQCNATDYSFKVFNRYGGVAFESSQTAKGWDGKTGQMDAPSGVYIWWLRYRNPNTKEVVTRQGTVVLLR